MIQAGNKSCEHRHWGRASPSSPRSLNQLGFASWLLLMPLHWHLSKRCNPFLSRRSKLISCKWSVSWIVIRLPKMFTHDWLEITRHNYGTYGTRPYVLYLQAKHLFLLTITAWWTTNLKGTSGYCYSVRSAWSKNRKRSRMFD